jgi:hypothetical protein
MCAKLPRGPGERLSGRPPARAAPIRIQFVWLLLEVTIELALAADAAVPSDALRG